MLPMWRCTWRLVCSGTWCVVCCVVCRPHVLVHTCAHALHHALRYLDSPRSSIHDVLGQRLQFCCVACTRRDWCCVRFGSVLWWRAGPCRLPDRVRLWCLAWSNKVRNWGLQDVCRSCVAALQHVLCWCC